MSDQGVIFVLSSGRCGTQWLASTLANVGSGDVVVAHEPIRSGYRSADVYRRYDASNAFASNAEVGVHLDNISKLRADGKGYVETGWPSYGAIPHLIERFGDDLALIHLTRHPVTTALSLATTIWNWSTPGWDAKKWDELSLPHPDRANVVQTAYAERWNAMSPFEQSLFWWTELQMYADEIAGRYPSVPVLRVSAEDLFARNRPTFETLLSFVGIGWREDALELDVVDKFRGWSSAVDVGDWHAVSEHPSAVAAAERLGYDPLRWDGKDD